MDYNLINKLKFKTSFLRGHRREIPNSMMFFVIDVGLYPVEKFQNAESIC